MTTATTVTALTAPNRAVEVEGRALAYRTFGAGPNLVLCIRLRGTMDSWDPLFLDKLAEHFTVTVFDYSGLGYSTGQASYAKVDMAKDVNDLVDSLDLGTVIIGGWSLGGFAAMVFTALHPEKVSHVLVIGTMPPGLMVKPSEDLFFPTAMKPIYSVEDEYILFFEPDGAYTRFFTATDIPVLALSGDHDLVFPVENWYAVNDVWPTLFVATWPESGHGPQHQYPELSADLIVSFVNHTPAP